jgi:GNAT superfamily N-acetyltransferase
MDPEEFVRQNADPIWLHREGRWEEIVPECGFVRPAEAADVPAIVALWQRFMSEEEAAVEHPDVEANRDRWRERLERQIEAGFAYVVENDDGISGFAAFIGRADEPVGPSSEKPVIPFGVAYVTDVYVLPDLRGTGAAAELLLGLVGAAYEAGFAKVWTNTDERNARAQTFFSRTGWRVMTGFALEGLERQVYFEHNRRPAHDDGEYSEHDAMEVPY